MHSIYFLEITVLPLPVTPYGLRNFIIFIICLWETHLALVYQWKRCFAKKNTCPFTVLPQRLSCLYSNEIEGFGNCSNISQGTAGPSSGVPFHSLSDPENLQNAYYVSSRAILEKPRFSHVDRRVAMKITVLPLWVTLNGLWNFMAFSHFSEFRTLEKTKKTRNIIWHNDFDCFELLGPTTAYDFPLKSWTEFIKNAPAENVSFQKHS